MNFFRGLGATLVAVVAVAFILFMSIALGPIMFVIGLAGFVLFCIFLLAAGLYEEWRDDS